MHNVHSEIVSICSKISMTKKEKKKVKNLFGHQYSGLSLQDILSKSKQHRVIPQVYLSLSEIGVDTEKLYPFKSAYQKIRTKDQLLFQQTRMVFDKFNELNIFAMGIKGVALREMYPKSNLRQHHDIDVLVPDIPSAWQVLSALNGLGSGLQALSLRQLVDSNLDIGGAARNLGVFDLPGKIDVDLHLGAFPIMSAKVYNGEMWNRRTVAKFGHSRMFIPSPEDCILLVCAHMYNSLELRLRDINDIYIIVKKYGREIDWDYVTAVSNKENFTPLLSCLLDQVKTSYQDISIPAKVDAFLRPKKVGKFIANSFCKAKQFQKIWSFILVVNHIFPFERKSLGFIKGMYESVAGYLYEVENGIRMKNKSGSILLLGVILNFLFGRPRKKIKLTRFRYTEFGLILPKENGREWLIKHIDIEKAMHCGERLDVPIRKISDQILIWRADNNVELALTPSGIYARHNRYLKGFYTHKKEILEAQTFKLVRTLNSVNAINADLIEN